jgi:hypothetical protein
MRKYLYIFPAVIAVIFAISGCSDAGVLQVNLDKEFTLAIGQSAQVKGEDLQIKFTGVSADSRCPADVTCIWAGEATCDIEIGYAGKTTALVLTRPGSDEQYTVEQFDGYAFSFKLEPYPQSGQQISPDMYRLHMVITRLPELTMVVGPVLTAPADYAEKDITITGYYRGWDLLHEADTAPPVTRSDWVIKDSSGAIYISAGSGSEVPEGLKPNSVGDTDTVLEVRGIVHIAGDGSPFIQALSVKRLY